MCCASQLAVNTGIITMTLWNRTDPKGKSHPPRWYWSINIFAHNYLRVSLSIFNAHYLQKNLKRYRFALSDILFKDNFQNPDLNVYASLDSLALSFSMHHGRFSRDEDAQNG
jgi:hypothetical protein